MIVCSAPTHRYRSVEENALDGTLMCGNAFSLYHKELEADLSCESAQAKAGGPLSLTPRRGARQHVESTAIWQIQAENERVGSACKWDGRFRLRHAASSRFLAVHKEAPSYGDAESTDAGDGDAKPATGGAASFLTVALVGATESRNSPEATLFRFVPQYPQEGNISNGHFFQIQHVQQGAFLHALQTTITVAAADEADEDGGDADVSKGAVLVASRFAHDTDIYGVRVVPQGVLTDLNYGLAALRPFHDFLRQVHELEEAAKTKGKASSPLSSVMTVDPGELQDDMIDNMFDPLVESVDAQQAGHGLDKRPLTQTLSDLICFVTQSDNADPYTREGMPIEKRQRMLAELGVQQLASECAEAPFRAHLYQYHEVRARTSHAACCARQTARRTPHADCQALPANACLIASRGTWSARSPHGPARSSSLVHGHL